MKVLKNFFGISALLLLALPAVSQQVTYSQPLKEDDYRHTEFEIIGKLKAGEPAQDKYSEHILVYKNNEGNHKIAVYAPNMELIGNVQLKFLTNGLLGVDFLSFPDHFMMLYQYQEGNFVYCKALVLNGNGRIIKNPVMIDSSEVGRKQVKSRIYSMVRSDDRSRIMVYKINQDNDYDNIFYTFSYDENLQFLRNSRLTLPMEDKHSFLAEFSLSNDGYFILAKESRPSKNSNVNKAALVIKAPLADTFTIHPFPLKGHYLERIKLKIDHKNHKVHAGALYTQGRKGDVEGLYAGTYSLSDNEFNQLQFHSFKESLRKSATQRGNLKNAFNNYFIRDFIIRGDGGFLITAEDYYTSSHYNDWNRWNGMYGPWGFSPYYSPYSSYYYSPFSPMMYSPYGYRNNRRNVSYHYQDVAILSFDSSQDLTWSNFIRKNQQDEQNASFLSYKMVNIGSALMFIYNSPFRRSFLLTAMSVTPNGKLSKLPTLRGLDQGYQWMPRFGKQIGARTVVIPCIYRNYICFAKIIF